MKGMIHQINISPGGVPKTPVSAAEVTTEGLVGDSQNDRKHHGGPMRAICLFACEIIEQLQAEGHPIRPGTVGENITTRGIDWSLVRPGARLQFEGGVELEITSYTQPCSTIRESFADRDSRRIKQELHPDESRVYARVLTPGAIRTGQRIEIAPLAD